MTKAIAIVLWVTVGISGSWAFGMQADVDIHLSDAALLTVIGAVAGPVSWAMVGLEHMHDPIMVHRKEEK